MPAKAKPENIAEYIKAAPEEAEESEAGFPELFKAMGWKVVLYSLSEGDFKRQDDISNRSVYEVYNYLQYLNQKTYCEKEYREILKRKNKL